MFLAWLLHKILWFQYDIRMTIASGNRNCFFESIPKPMQIPFSSCWFLFLNIQSGYPFRSMLRTISSTRDCRDYQQLPWTPWSLFKNSLTIHGEYTFLIGKNWRVLCQFQILGSNFRGSNLKTISAKFQEVLWLRINCIYLTEYGMLRKYIFFCHTNKNCMISKWYKSHLVIAQCSVYKNLANIANLMWLFANCFSQHCLIALPFLYSYKSCLA